MSPYELAKLFHETYERLAPDFGYATRKETAIPWESIPEDSPNKQLMCAVASEVLQHLPGRDGYLKRIADAFEASNKLLEAGNTINNEHVSLQKQWRVENLVIEKQNQARQDDWVDWQKGMKLAEVERQERINAQALEQSLKLQQELQDAMLAKYEVQLREQLRENALAAPVHPANGSILLCKEEE